LFFFDATPAPVVTESTQRSTAQPESSKSAADRLLLPSHVSILSAGADGAVPVEIVPQLPVDSEEENYIEYLDYEDRKVCGQ
jgi:protein AIR1/2